MGEKERARKDLYLVLADCKYVNVILLWRIQTYNSALFSQVKFSVLVLTGAGACELILSLLALNHQLVFPSNFME